MVRERAYNGIPGLPMLLVLLLVCRQHGCW
jgi:hypothetical protein